MVTIKSFTDISQSKKLAEILPIESADMHYCLEKRDVKTGYEIGTTPFIKAKRFEGKCNIVNVQPAWSIAALLEQLPYPQLSKDKLGSGKVGWIVSVYPSNCRYDSNWHDNPIDACVAMIEKLHELNLL